MNSTSAFQIQNLTLGYDRRIILNQLSLTVASGRMTALIGPNGCGKSTLLKAMARILPPKSGVVHLADQTDLYALNAKAAARRIALLPQSPVVPEGIRVRDLVAYGRSPHLNALGRLREPDHNLVNEAMERMNVVEFAEQAVARLSGGQRQRVWIAMILAQQTEIILLDEPTTYLDLAHQYELLERVRELTEEGRTVVTVLHDLNQACRYADELVVMKSGQRVTQGSPEKVFTEAMLADVFGLNARIITDPETGTPLCLPRSKPRAYGARAVA